MELPSEAVLEGRVAFGDIGHLWAKGSMLGGAKEMKGGKYVSTGAGADAAATAAAAAAGMDTGEMGAWKTNLSSNGTVYYYNTETRETSWTKPTDQQQ
jgi:hypothetical protein